MKINLLTIGHKMPNWVAEGFHEYQERLPKDYQLNLIALKPQINMSKEGEELLAAIPPNNFVIALDRLGVAIKTQELSIKLLNWHDNAQDISLLIGGAEGLSTECLQRAAQTWSLSTLTLPHQLVRIVVAEQIYRAWTILNKHPYHK